jgi:hypothetical protein
MRSIGMPVRSLASITNAVPSPWPCDDTPERTIAPPSFFTRRSPTRQLPMGLVTSTYDAMPMPSNFGSPAAATRLLLGTEGRHTRPRRARGRSPRRIHRCRTRRPVGVV